MRALAFSIALCLGCASTGSHDGGDDVEGGFECGPDPCVPYACFCLHCGESDMQCVRQSWVEENDAVLIGERYGCDQDCPIVTECPTYTCSCSEEGECVQDE